MIRQGSTGSGQECTPRLVEAQLERILASPGFASSERPGRLLRHLVSMSLAGRGAEISEYALGVDIFGRGESFDPQIDAIVRAEVSRLRAKLKRYYRTSGSGDPVVVDLPPRSYVPVFHYKTSTESQTAGAGETRRRSRLWVLSAPLLALALIGIGYRWLGRPSATSARAESGDELTSVAVLPFVNSGGDRALEQFADGLTEEVIETLEEVNGLRVVSRSSAFRFKGTHEDVQKVAQKLRVGTVLEGEVRRSAGQIRVTTRLVGAADGYQYYSRVYEHELRAAAAIQREIAADVANALRANEKGQEVARFTKSAEAHSWYLRGLKHSNSLAGSELTQAIDCYRRAIEYDPRYSPAYAGLSEAYITLALLDETNPREAMGRAAEAARNAVRTGETYAHAHAALGSVLALYDWNWAAAEKEFRKAIEGDPDDSPILQQYAMRYLVPQVDLDSAAFELQRALQVDPFSPQARYNRGRVEYFRHAPARALTEIRAALEIAPDLEVAPLGLAQAYAADSQFDAASKVLQASTAPTEDEARLAVLGSIYGLAGHPESARRVLEQLTELDRHYKHVSGFYLSQIYLELGDTSSALACLEKAAEERSPLIVYVKASPVFDRLRQEARFQALLGKIGLGR